MADTDPPQRDMEQKKPLRQKLFHLLAMRSDFLRRCLDFHFVCWGATHRHQPPGFATPIVEEIDLLNRYAVHVSPFMDAVLEIRDSADISTQAFLDTFLGSRLMGGTYERFKRYCCPVVCCLHIFAMFLMIIFCRYPLELRLARSNQFSARLHRRTMSTLLAGYRRSVVGH